MSSRVALYYAPDPETALARFGAAVLGYDAARGVDVAQITPHGFAPRDWSASTAEPRKYGFHATLKAPFRMRDGATEDELHARLNAFAASQAAFSFAAKAAAIGRFIALVPVEPTLALMRLASRCVEGFDDLRAPLSEAERVRRLAHPLTERQLHLLERFGYPYVLDEFRFHMTLTGPLDALARGTALAALERLFVEHVPDRRIDVRSIALFRQDEPDARFRIAARAPLLARCDKAG